MNPFRKESKNYLFYELASPDEQGHSREVLVEEFTGKYERLTLGNGGDWCRTDGALGKKFLIERRKLNGKGRIISVQLFGHNTKAKILKQIKAEIVKDISSRRCVILDVGSSIEVDHKDGHRDDFSNLASEDQTLEQFQPLSKSANTAKREHCKKCRDSKKRFDAKVLGYSASVWVGDLKYRGSCVGCYWFDPKQFNERISVNFSKG